MDGIPCGLDVILGQGLGEVCFGMSVREVEALLGRAPEASFYDDAGERTIALRYPGMSLSFHQSDDFRLSIIEVDEASQSRLFGEPLFPRNREEILDLLRRGLSDVELSRAEERTDEDLEEMSLNLRSHWVTFYFDLSGELREVNWAVFVGPEDEIVWPELYNP